MKLEFNLSLLIDEEGKIHEDNVKEAVKLLKNKVKYDLDLSEDEVYFLIKEIDKIFGEKLK